VLIFRSIFVNQFARREISRLHQTVYSGKSVTIITAKVILLFLLLRTSLAELAKTLLAPLMGLATIQNR
jgi:hypothetical protein